MTAQKKAPAKKKISELENIVQEVEAEAQLVEVAAKDEAHKLEGLTVQQLRDLHKEALIAESDAKREVHVLRQRAANLATDADVRAEEEVIAAKHILARAAAWVKEIEQQLEHEFLDIYDTKRDRK
jgi:ribosomal protein L35